LRLSRAYGKRTRHIEDIYLNQLIFIGTVEEAEAKNPRTHRVHAFHKKAPLPVTAVVYQCSTGKRMALVQLNEELRAALIRCMKEK